MRFHRLDGFARATSVEQVEERGARVVHASRILQLTRAGAGANDRCGRDLRLFRPDVAAPMLIEMEHDRNGLEVLDRDECLQLLSGCSLGRVAVSVGALPVILPVNFLLDRERILIRTGPGTKLDAATRDSVVAFEVDHIDPFSHGGWSVCLTGMAREVKDEAELAA